MSVIPKVPAVLIAMNVKPHGLGKDESLMQTVPLLCAAEGLEWSCVVFSKGGAADALNHTGVPLPIIVQDVLVHLRNVRETASGRCNRMAKKQEGAVLTCSAVCSSLSRF